MGRQGIELPHWDMFKRRLWRTPGRWAIIQGLAWIALTLWFPGEWLNEVLPRMGWYMPDYADIALVFISCLGFSLLYLAIAYTMTQLADTGEITSWYLAPLSSKTALHGVLLAALTQASVPLAGLFAFMSTQMVAYCGYSNFQSIFSQTGGEIFSFYFFTGTLLLRLPHFALACACYAIAFRNSTFKHILPVIMTIAAVTAIFINTKEIYFFPDDPGSQYTHMSSAPLWTANLTVMPLIGLTAIVLLGVVLTGQARKPLNLGWQWFLIAIPALAFFGGTAGIVQTVTQIVQSSNITFERLLNQPVLQPLHASLTHLFPNLAFAWCGDTYYGNNIVARQIFGITITDSSQWLWPDLSYCISLAIWYFAAIACLNAARYPTLPWRKLLSR